jgi:hypothetical protein
MIREDLIVAAYERKACWAGWIPNTLTIDCDANVFIAIQHSVQVFEVLAFGILQSDT